MKIILQGFIVAFCLVFAQCSEDDLTKSENEVKCSVEIKTKPQKGDRFNHHYHDSEEDFDDSHGFFGQAPRQSARKTNYCVNIPRRPNRDSGSRAITEFAWKLFKNSNTQANYVLSPLNPQIILSYLAWIAEGKTRNELVSATGYGSPTSIHRTIDSVLRDDSKRELQLSTAFFVANNIVLNQKFVDQADGKADIVQVDFKDSEATGRKFKKWVDQKTKGGLKINDISFDQSTKMALTSALYFKSTWIYKFQPAKKGIFKGPKGDVEVEMMQMKQQFRWGKIDDYAEWVAIPYESEDSLVIILPNKNKTLDDVMTTFNERALTEIMYDFDRDSADADVNITMPKFKIESTTNLIKPLTDMGIHDLFSSSSSLPYFGNDTSLQVSSAQQQSSIDVNEEGTVAITITNFHFVALSVHIPIPDVTFVVDRPFLAIVANRDRNIPLVMAKVVNPTY